MSKTTQFIFSEDNESYALASYLELLQGSGKIEVYSHVPHETYTTSWAVKMKNKRKGVKKGVPDYIIVTKSTVLFIELKIVKGGTVSVEQKNWIETLNGKSCVAQIANGLFEAKNIIEKYL